MNINDQASQYLLNIYNTPPFEVSHGEGVYLFDTAGNKYLDLLAGIAVNALGYNHSIINRAIEEQYRKMLHLSNIFVQPVQVELAKKLTELTDFDKVCFTNSGTEAIEGLLKLVKKWGNANKKKQIRVSKVVFMAGLLAPFQLRGKKSIKIVLNLYYQILI